MAERIVACGGVARGLQACGRPGPELRLPEGEPGQALAFLREAAEGFAKAGRPVDEQRCRTAAEAIARAPSRP